MPKKKTMKEDVKDMKKVAKQLAWPLRCTRNNLKRCKNTLTKWKNKLKMTDAQMDKREKIVMPMKPKMQGFKDRYDDAKSVMYATATKQAMKD